MPATDQSSQASRRSYAASSVLALYLNVFGLIVQLFPKVSRVLVDFV